MNAALALISASLFPHLSLPTHLCFLILPSHLGLPVPHHSPLLPSPHSPVLFISTTSLPGTAQLFGPEESHVFIIICGEPDIVVVLAQGPAPPTLDAKPEPLDTQTTSA